MANKRAHIAVLVALGGADMNQTSIPLNVRLMFPLKTQILFPYGM
jgi:hypothetical protein